MTEIEDDCGANYEDQQKMMEEQEKLENEFKKSGWAMYARPPFIQKNGGKLQFMQIECDYYTVKNESIIRMFGVTAEGNSLLVNVKNFLSYFYIQAPTHLDLSEQSIQDFQQKFNEQLASQKQFAGNLPIAKIEICQKENIRNYKGKNINLINYLKVYTFHPNYVAKIRNYVKSGDRSVDSLQLSDLTFESNIPYSLRFMVDYQIAGMGWIEVTNYTIRKQKISCCQIEIDVDCNNIHAISLDIQSDIAPLRIFSFDIECGAKRGFPQDTQDPIIQIACIVKNHNSDQEIVKVVFALLETESFPGARVKSFNTEKELLLDFQLFLQQLDPDIIIGYNSQNFDLPYLLGRAKQLKIQNEFGKFGRISSTFSVVKDGKFMSKAMGMRDTKDINIEGRIQLDMMVHMMREHKLSSFSLNNVSFQFLKQQKEDVHHSIIYTLWQSNVENRKRLAIYCLKDAQLPILLMEKLCCIYNYSEMARVTGVPINYLFMRGQQIKVASQILRKSKQYDYIMPTETSHKSDAEYEGAFVIKPIKAFYKLPIATLDFASLYPSIMMAHNMCYCTLLKDSWQKVGLTNEDDVTQTPETNVSFVKPHIRKGILPMILEDLINARKKARQQLALEKDPFKKAVLDGRQLALKISANSVYGFTGAQIGQLPCLEISSSITSFGRQMIKLTQELVQKTYSKENGCDHDAEVIYGDTDSVMVKFGVSTVKEAMELGKKAADQITTNFISPIKLEFEKVYCPYLLMNSKKYAGLLYTKNPEIADKIDTKGIESVRRDNCFLIRKMVTKIMEYLLIDQDEKKAVHYVQEQIRNLFTNKIDISELVITKSLNKKSGEEKDKKQKQQKDERSIAQTYKQRQAHVILAEKMQKRDETTGPASGDRIAYIMIQGTKGSKNYENAEDPIEVLEKDFPIDYDYYLEKQIKKPLERIFEHIVPNVSVIFVGEHTNVRYVPKLSVNSALGKFVQKRNACLKCKSLIKDNEALCFSCKDNQLEILCKQAFELNELQFKYHQYGSTCQGCQGSLHQDILCTNRDCEIFYKRVKVTRELSDKWIEHDKLQSQQW